MRVQPGEPNSGLGPETYAYTAKRYTFPYTRVGMARGWQRGRPGLREQGCGDGDGDEYEYEQE